MTYQGSMERQMSVSSALTYVFILPQADCIVIQALSALSTCVIQIYLIELYDSD